MTLSKAIHAYEHGIPALAKKLKKSKVTVYSWMKPTGKPKLCDVIALAEVLGTTVSALIGEPQLTPDEQRVLYLARRMGVDKAHDRLALIRGGKSRQQTLPSDEQMDRDEPTGPPAQEAGRTRQRG